MTTEQFINELSTVTGVDYRAQVPAGTLLGEEVLDGTPGATARYYKPNSHMRAGASPLPERLNLYDKVRHDISFVPPTIANARMSKNPGRYTLVKPLDWHDNDPKIIEETCEVCLSDPERPADAERPKFTSWDQLQMHYEFWHEFSWRRMERDRVEAERREDRSAMSALLGTLINVIKPDAELPEAVKAQIARIREGAEEKPVRGARAKADTPEGTE